MQTLKQRILAEIKIDISVIIQRSVQQEEVTITNVNVPNN